MEILNIYGKKYTKKYSLLLVYLFFIVLASCEKEANVKIPETEPKPVLVCFISPEDSLIRVQLTNSIPLYTANSSKYPYEIKDAKITISNGVNSAVIPWFKDSVGYQLSTDFFTIGAGTTYTLEVTIPDGRKLNSRTTVPAESFPPFEISITKNLLDSSEFGVSYEFLYNLSWKDFANTENYYRGVIYNLYNDSGMGADTSAQIINELFESDKGKDGSEIKIGGQGFIFYIPGSSTPASSSNYIAYLMLCNKDYFDYHKDLYTNNDVNPFAEARLNFSNIEGGIGCFGAYRVAKKRF